MSDKKFACRTNFKLYQTFCLVNIFLNVIAWNFIKWIRILHKYAQSAIITNGVISRYFPVERGIRQGDSLSALLYIIQAEPMAQAIRDSDSMEGIHTKSMEGEWIEYRLTQYAYDTTIILKHFDMIQTALDLLKKFGTASGSKLNARKTKCLIFQQNFPPGFDVQFTTGPERYWGFLLVVTVICLSTGKKRLIRSVKVWQCGKQGIWLSRVKLN